MSLGTKEIVAIAVASTLSVAAVGGIGGPAIYSKVKYDTFNFPKVMSVIKQFNNLAKSDYGKTLEQNNSFFKVVKQFIDNPRNNVLIAIRSGEKYIFSCLSKEEYSKREQSEGRILKNYDAVKEFLKIVEAEAKKEEEKDKKEKQPVAETKEEPKEEPKKEEEKDKKEKQPVAETKEETKEESKEETKEESKEESKEEPKKEE